MLDRILRCERRVAMKRLQGKGVSAGAMTFVCVLMLAKAACADANILRQGFCVTKTANGCGEVILPDTRVDIARLPKLPDGTRGIYFYSSQQVMSKTTLVHLLWAEDSASHVEYSLPQKAGPQANSLKASLKALVTKLAPEGAVTVTPFSFDPAEQPSLAMSFIPVTGPGSYDARIVDLKGVTVSGSQPVSISVIQTK